MAEGIRGISAVVAQGAHCNGKYVREGGKVVFSVQDMSLVKHEELQVEAGLKLDQAAISEAPISADAGQYFFVPPGMLYLSGSGFDFNGHPRIPKVGNDEMAKAETRRVILEEMSSLTVEYDAS